MNKEKYENQLFYHMMTALISGIFGFCMIAISLPEREMDWYVPQNYAFYNGVGFFLVILFVCKIIKIIKLIQLLKKDDED